MYYDLIKRTIDVLGAALLLLIFSPILLATSVMIKLTSDGPVFADVPRRLGKNGKLFHIFKFRSMIVNAHTLLRTDPRFRKLYKQFRSPRYKLVNDPRITDVGKFIRKHSIDELPQLINVLRGEMSIVGPRPYYMEELEFQQENFPETRKLVKEVLTVKPGITGFWQVSGRSDVDFDKRIEMDAYYARKKSILLDILILLKTPWIMVSGKGAA